MLLFTRLLRRHFIATSLAALSAGYAQAQNKAVPGKELNKPGTASTKPKASNSANGVNDNASTQSATLLVLGDSLSAEYGLRRGTGWVALLEKHLAAQQLTAKVVNASISGETTSGGRSRMPLLLKTHAPSHVLIELGGNDALRGLPLAMTEANLTYLTKTAQAAGAKVLLLGMQMPPNYGAAYAADFAAVFDKVAKAHKAALVPVFLKGVADADDPLQLFQADRIHPKEEAQPLMLGNVWPLLSKLLK